MSPYHFGRRFLASVLALALFTEALLPLHVFAEAKEKDKAPKEEKIKKSLQLETVRLKYLDENDQEKINTLRGTLKKHGKYRVIIASAASKAQIEEDFRSYDATVKDFGNGLYEILVPQTSAIAQDVLVSIDSDKIPETLFGEYQVIEPEVVESLDTLSLSGEQLSEMWGMSHVGADTFQESLVSLPSLKVGVMDTGIDATHSDLSDSISSLSYDFINDASGSTDDNGHGTNVAGVIAGAINGGGIFGVNPQTELVSLKVLDANGYGTTYDILEAIAYAQENDIAILNMSFGGGSNPSTHAVCSALADAQSDGIIIVAAAGNSNTTNTSLVPANCEGVINVGALQEDGSKAAFSNYGSNVELFAPGDNILTATNGNSFALKNGTSLAAAFVSGLLSKELVEGQTARGNTLIAHLQGSYDLIPENLSTGTGMTGTGLSATGGIINYDIPPPTDWNTYKYYSGTFTQSGKTYGNSLYSESMMFTGFDTNQVEVISYETYQNLLAKQTYGTGEFQALSVPTSGLVGYWPLDGSGTDLSGNNRHVIPVGVSWTGAIAGNFQSGSADFGGSAYVVRGDDLGMTNSGQNFTLSLWIRPNVNLSSQSTFINYVDQDYHNYSYIEYYAGAVRFIRVRGGIAADIASYTTTLTGGRTYHLAGTYDGSDLRLYIDHEQVATFSSPGNGNVSYSDGFYLGTYQGYGYGTYNGHMQSVRVYDRALSDSEVDELYYELEGTPPPSNNTTETTRNDNYVNTGATASVENPKSHPIESNQKQEQVQAQTEDAPQVAVNIKNAADPVTLSNGEFTYDNTLMSIPGVGMPYELKVAYKNQIYYNGPAGINWDHNYNLYLTGDSNSIILYDGEMGSFRFFGSGGTFDYNSSIRGSLISTGGLYQINYDDGRITKFNSGLRVSEIIDASGNKLIFSYSGSYLTGVTDTLGRTISYQYWDHNRLKTVTDFNGRKVDFVYYTGNTNSGSYYDLKDIILTNGTGTTKTINFEYSTGSTDESAHNITRLIDANGQTYVVNTYDANDRVATQKYGTGTLSYSYTLSGSSVTKNTVTDKLGLQTEYTYDVNGNKTSVKYSFTGGTSSVTYNYEYNGSGLVIKETRPKGNGYTYDYDIKGNLIEKRFKTDTSAGGDSSNLITTYTYDSNNRVLSETSPEGAVITYTRDSAGNILTKSLDNIESATGATYSGVTTYTYTSSGLLESINTPEGNYTKFHYSSGQVSKVVRGTGSLTSTGSMTYDDYGNMLTLTDGEGFTKTMSYTPWNLLSTGTTAEGVIMSYAYDANNNKTRETKYLSGTAIHTYFYYDTLDRLTKTEETVDSGKVLTTLYTYDENDNLTSKKVGSGATVTYTYDAFAKPTEQRVLLVPGDSSKDLVTTYTYDSGSNLKTITDPRGKVTTHTYSLYDRITESVLPDNTELHYTYNADNTVDTVTTESSTGYIYAKTKTLYDGFGQTTKVSQFTNPNVNTGSIDTTTIYDRDLRPIQIIDPKGNTTSTLYNGRGKATVTTDALGNTVTIVYDKRDLPTSKTITPIGGASANTTTYTYDDDGRVLSEENELSETTSYIYNSLNQVTRITDALSHNKDFTYDYVGRKKSETETDSGTTITTSYGYDERGNLTTVTDGEGNVTTYTYDAANRNTAVTYEDATSITMTYDKNNNLATRTDAMGTVITNTYDDMNRMTSRAISTGTGVGGVTMESYSYDALGRMIGGSDSQSGALAFSYDALSRLTSESQYISGSSTKTTSYTYDSGSNLTSLTHPDSRVQTFSYDALNRNTSIIYSGSTVATYTYTGILLADITYGNSTSKVLTYDDLYRPASLTTSGGDYDYSYSDVGDITGDGERNYVYDALRRLKTVSLVSTGSAPKTEGYAYDRAANRTSSIANGTSTSYTTNDLNQYTATSGGDTKSYTYDNNGNLKSDGTKLYTYDYQNRLVEVKRSSDNTTIAIYTYDLLGRRTKKVDSSRSTNASETILYTYSNENTIAEEKTIRSGTSSIILNKVYINGLGTDNLLAYDTDERTISDYNLGKLFFCESRVFPYESEFIGYAYTGITTDCSNLLVTSSGTTHNRYYVHTNHQGSVIALTSSTGVVVQQYSYDSFGVPYVKSGTGVNTVYTLISSYTGSLHENTRLYTSREYDRETNLYFLRARYYSPSTGKFISRDPIGQNDQINLYTYVGNSPMMYVDPSGLLKIILAETRDRLVSWIGKTLVFAAGVDTLQAPGDVTHDEDIARGDKLQEEVDNPEGPVFAMGLFLSPNGKKAAIGKIFKDIKKIVNGHAIKHLDEFGKFGVKNVDDLEKHAQGVIKYAKETGSVKQLDNGRVAIWDDTTETIIIRDPGRDDLGTIFVHNMEKTKQTFQEYINNLQ